MHQPIPADDPRPTRLRAAEAVLETAWARGWARRPTLDPAQLIGKAAAQAGVAPDDDASGWRERLALLCGDLEREARLTRLGRTIAHGQLVAALANRFRAHALWRRRPAILEQPLPAPIIVVGQMRSGTTRMQRLLACDPRLAATRFFESWNPVPRGDDGAGWPDGRKLRGWAGLACARLLNPRFDALHPTRWNAPDEEIGLQALSIFGAGYEAQWRVPAYRTAVEEGDAVPVYREFRRFLQTIAWLRGETGARPWILKVPQFTQDLAALLRVFPDARLICLHRDPAAVVASSVALVENQMALQSAEVDRGWIRAEWERKLRLRTERMTAARATADVPQIDVGFDAVGNDWEREIRRVYAMLGLSLPPAVIARMGSYVRQAGRSSPRHRPAPPPQPAEIADFA